MCYNLRFLTERKIKYAKRLGADVLEIEQLESELEKHCKTETPTWFVNAFAHPKLLCITSSNFSIELLSWGLIPHWVDNEKDAFEIANKTINARCETLFEKPAFRRAATHNRCLVVTDGFYEYHHYNKKIYPYHVVMQNGEPMIMAGIFSVWENIRTKTIEKTVSIVTTQANKTLAEIHNNRKKEEPRIPIILNKQDDALWLSGELNVAKAVMKPIADSLIRAYSVAMLTGHKGVGNSSAAIKNVHYPELDFKNNRLF